MSAKIVDPKSLLMTLGVVAGLGLCLAFLMELGGIPMNWWDRLGIAAFWCGVVLGPALVADGHVK